MFTRRARLCARYHVPRTCVKERVHGCPVQIGPAQAQTTLKHDVVSRSGPRYMIDTREDME